MEGGRRKGVSSTRTNAFHPPEIGHASSLPRVCFWKMRFVFARQIGCPPRNVFRGWIPPSDGIERFSSRFEWNWKLCDFFSFWKTNFVTICKLCKLLERRVLDTLISKFLNIFVVCLFIYLLILKMYTLKKYRVYFFNVRILIINPVDSCCEIVKVENGCFTSISFNLDLKVHIEFDPIASAHLWCLRFAVWKGEEKAKKGKERGGKEDGPRSSIARIVQKGEVAKRYAARNSFLDKVAAESLWSQARINDARWNVSLWRTSKIEKPFVH